MGNDTIQIQWIIYNFLSIFSGNSGSILHRFYIFDLETIANFFLQYFDTVGWVFLPVKTVSHITYTVLVET